jgi:hypothetical protein
MAETLDAPLLVATLERLLDRERRRARDAALRRTSAATALAVLVVALWRIADRVIGREPMPATRALLLVALVAAVGLAFALRGARGRSDGEMAREVDRRLGLEDRASAALAVVRGGADSRLAGFVVRDAEESLTAAGGRVDDVFPAKAAPRDTAPVRWLRRAAAAVALLAVFAELLTIGGPIRLLPGISGGGEESAVVPPDERAPPGTHRRPGRDRPDAPEDPAKEPEEKEPDRTKPPEPEGDVRVVLRMAKDEFDDKEPVEGEVLAASTGGPVAARTYDVRISVDGVEADTGAEVTVDAAQPQGGRAELDLRKVPGLKLAPGEHVARARLTTRTSHEEHASEPVKFVIRPPKKDDGSNGGGPPKPKPKPKPDPNSQSGQPEKKEEPAAQAPPLPPPETEKHVVTPLFGEGDLVKKKGLVLVLDPGGGTAGPPSQKPLADVLPDAKRRAEEAVDLARVPAEDRDLVRRYFELLEELRK